MRHNQKACTIVIAMAIASLVFAATNSSYAQNEKYRAKLKGDNEVPPVNSTAEGVINFKTKNNTLTWKMNVSGITEATGANINLGKKGENGEIIVNLLQSSKHGQKPAGMILSGSIEPFNLTGSMKGKSLTDLKTAMANGDTYVNIHTNNHPNGEIRGQVKLKGLNATAPVNATVSTNSTS